MGTWAIGRELGQGDHEHREWSLRCVHVQPERLVGQEAERASKDTIKNSALWGKGPGLGLCGGALVSQQ